MGKFTDAIKASGKQVSPEAISLLEHFESIVTDVTAHDKSEVTGLVQGVKDLVEANAKDLGEHKETLLKLAAKVDAQVDKSMLGITSRESFGEAIKANAEALEKMANSNNGRLHLTIKNLAADPLMNDPNYPAGFPLPERAGGIGRIPMLMSNFWDDVDKITYGRAARPVVYLDITPFEGDAAWWEKKNTDGSWMQKADVSWGYTSATAGVNTIAVKTRAFKFDLLDLEFLQNDIYNTLRRLIERAVRKAILLGNPTLDPNSPNGAYNQAVAYNNPSATGTVAMANVVDAIAKMACQIEQAGYEGQIVAYVSPAIMCEMKTLKANNGTYLDYTTALTGVIVRPDMSLTGNQVLVGIPEFFHVRLFGDVEIDIVVGSVKDADGNVIGTTPEYNMVEFLAEQRLLAWIFTNDKPAFVKADDISTVVDDINKVDA